MIARIIYAALALLALIGLTSFFFMPAYEKGVWVVLVALSNCLSAALGAKFGLSTVAPPTPETPAEPTPDSTR